ncbi:DUF6867 family protein [Aquabacter spiritensis]|uniref:DUF6867 domain-containing protein n=1 Tax=Aquabacter spiritensis TaxID=933073 RepID=A0A4R3LQQ5_9HYPH|nr:hypothetical protein [Aquabacter spiritensis]TCT02720.1 hypothetical protein EDC64_112159 [Aquabacter spiritensis]
MAPIAEPGRPSAPMLVLPLVVLVAILVLSVAHPSSVVEVSTGDFMLVTLFLGGGAAFLTGRAVAKGWSPFWQVLVYSALLTGAVRFCHFALFQGTLFAYDHYLLELALLFAIATLGFRAVRKQQMTHRYGWLFEPAGWLCWRARRGRDGDPAS